MNVHFDLNTIWFLLIGFLFAGYAVLDGFDLGVGALHLLTRSDRERRIMINAIGPFWDGNEVWLVTGGGALFAAFPEVYATVFSGFYTAFMLFLFALIFRAVAIEFRGKRQTDRWRMTWDASFAVSSIAVSLILGVALGNIAKGLPLDVDRNMAQGFFHLLNPYALLVGITTLSLFVMHGAVYLLMRSEGELHKKVRRWVRSAIIAFVLFYVLTTIATLIYVPRMVQPFRKHPLFLIAPILTLLAVANIYREIHLGRELRAFISSALSILGLLILFGLGTFPYLVYSDPEPLRSLDIYNAASSPRTLRIMLIIALVGMPFVIAYTAAVYRIFRGKVKLDSSSY